MASVGLGSFFRNLGAKLEPEVTQHLQNVYACLAISLLTAAAGSYVHVVTGVLQGGLFMSILALVLLILLAATPDNGKNQALRLGYLTGFSFMSGLNLGPLLDNAIAIDPTIISTALLATAVIFISFSFSAMMCEQTHYLYLGGTLLSGLSIVSILGLLNLFIGSRVLYEANLYLGLFVMCGFILYDTQLMIVKRRMGDKDYIWHSINLFIDFINIFRYLLILLSNKDSKKKNRD